MTPDHRQLLTKTIEAPPGDVVTPGRMRRALVVSYDFPPNRTSAVYRMTGITRSLPQYGWAPTVLTIRGSNFAQEPALLDKLSPQIEIVRTKFLRVNAWEDHTATAIQSVGGLQPEGGEAAADIRLVDTIVRGALSARLCISPTKWSAGFPTPSPPR